MSQFKKVETTKQKTNDSWIDNYDEQINEKSVQANQLKTFTPVNTLSKKQEIIQNVPHPSAFKKDVSEPQNIKARLPLQIITKELENIQQLNLQGGPSTPNMLGSTQGIQRSTTALNQANNIINEQSFAYLKEIETKNLNKFVSQREELDIFKHLSLIYNVNTIVNPDFASSLKIPKEVQIASVESLKLQNRIQVKQYLQAANNTVIYPPQQSKFSDRSFEKPYKHILTSLFYENKPDQQLLVVEFVNIGSVGAGGGLTSGNANNGAATSMGIQNSIHNALLSSQKIVDGNNFIQNYKAFPTLYHLNFESPRDPSPFIAIDRIQGRHFIYNNDDKIMVFSHEPISNPMNDKSRPLLYMSLDDKLDDIQALKANGGAYDIGESQQNPQNSGMISFGQGKARINPTLQIITDNKGNSALLVIGGYVDQGSGVYSAKMNIKVFGIGKRKVDMHPQFQIMMKQPRINPIVMRVKQSDCKDPKISSSEDRKYLLLLGGAIANVVDNKKIFLNTNTSCSVIEYENIFKQLERRDTTQLEIQQTLKVFYNDKDQGKNYERIAQFLSKGVFIHQKDQRNSDIHNKMYVITDKKKQILHVHAISMSQNFVNIFDSDAELKAENQWCYTNMCIYDSFLIYITPQQFYPTIIETNSKNSKQMQFEDLVELNHKRKKDIFEIKPKQNKASCTCTIF